jgi:hypothetical protein
MTTLDRRTEAVDAESRLSGDGGGGSSSSSSGNSNSKPRHHTSVQLACSYTVSCKPYYEQTATIELLGVNKLAAWAVDSDGCSLSS